MTVQEAAVFPRPCSIIYNVTVISSFCTRVVHRAEVTSPRCGALRLLVEPCLSHHSASMRIIPLTHVSGMIHESAATRSDFG